MNRILALIVSVSALACQIQDGDLTSTAALTGLTLTASEDALSARQTTITGDIGLGYTSPMGVDLEIRDGGLPLYRTSMAADALTLPVEATLDLPYHSLNHLVAEATYNGQSISQTLTVDVPEPIASVALTASEDQLSLRQSVLTGTITLGYTGAGMVDLRVMDDGVEVYRGSADGAALSIPLEQTVSLVSAGRNTLSLEATYDGSTVASSVDVTLPNAILDITDLVAGTDTLSERTSAVTATVGIGYLSAHQVDLRLLDNSTEIWRDAVAADTLSIGVDVSAALLAPGFNNLTLEATYDGVTIARSVSVTVPEAILDITNLAATTDALSTRMTTVSADLGIGYTSAGMVDVRLLDNSTEIWRDAVPAASLSLPLSVTANLLDPATNTLTLEATYDGDTVARSTSVVVPEPILGLTGLQATLDTLDTRTSVVSVGVDLGYTSAANVELRLLDNSVEVWHDTVLADALSLAADVPVGLLFPGTNTLLMEASYGGATLAQTVDVVVPDPLMGLDFGTASVDVTQLSADVSGTVNVGVLSADPAVLTLVVNGQSAITRTLDASAGAAVPFAETLPLNQEGINSLEAWVTYQGATMSQSLEVMVPNGVQAFGLLQPAAPTSLATTVEGTALLGYTSTAPASVEILVDGALAWSGVYDATTATQVDFSQAVALPHEGVNDIVANVRYGNVTMTDAFSVTVPHAVQGLRLSPLSGTVNVYESAVTGSMTVGYLSDTPAVLDVFVNGANVFSELEDVSTSMTVPLNLTVPLSREGANDVVARLTYGGGEYTDGFTVAVEPAAATVTVGAWTSNLVPGTSYTWNNTMTVDPPAGWTVSAVATSLDGGVTWTPADRLDPLQPDWMATVLNPDLGSVPVLIAVDMLNRGQLSTTYTSTNVQVDPIFDCLPGSGSMAPTTDMAERHFYETRTLMGYFGNDTGLHRVSFGLHALSPQNGQFDVIGTNVQYGPFAVDTEFVVDQMRCNRNNNASCSLGYDLSASLDGVEFCTSVPSRNFYGQIWRF